MYYLNALIILTGLLINNHFLQPVIQNLDAVEPQVVDLKITHIFGEQLDIQARLEPVEGIRSVILAIETEDHKRLVTETLRPSSRGEIFYIHKLTQHAVQVFSELSIQFEIEMINGTVYTTEPTTYLYDDNRFQWQTLENGKYLIAWYQKDPDLGHKISTTVYEGISRINNFIQAPSPEGIRIYAYESAVDMQDTLKFSGETSSWIAGHAEPHFNTIVVSLPPGPDQILEIRRQIPHELVHILLYQKLGIAYNNLPRWLNEGLASSAELFPNPDYQLLLEKAYERGSIIPIRDLCDNFPIDAANFQLAYAESFAFTWYLQETYGKDGMENLIQAYAQDKSCDQAVQDTFELTLAELETTWRQTTFSETPALEIGENTISLMILVGFAFIVPLGLMIKGIGKRERE